ncbi:MAG: o-succinylbenzoate synthase [Bacteroidetes bacterium]|nr:o-succinylbenzoate synthase [Bacteroidota bacterium]MDA0943656.1 o-succinylbenzoate synthase [Bacteroidota bacterium]MDA1111563.1 o-succinylbenzoate synthase [Bacteroidota bacterium]
MFTLDILPHTLKFIKPAKTSRGEYAEKTAWILVLRDEKGAFGLGEASPLHDLSVDGKADYEAIVRALGPLSQGDLLDLLDRWAPGGPEALPALRFALHCAMRHYKSFDDTLGYAGSFSKGDSAIAINGLVWMNELDAMWEEAEAKFRSRYSCLKFKIGAHDFDAECRLLERARKMANAFKLEIRVDANGAFNGYEALEKLRELSRFELHSIEQPIAAGQGEMMAELCAQSPIDIALDEELIGFHPQKHGFYFQQIGAQYLILKPTLLGGLDLASEWVSLARKEGMKWWATSALEGNIGLSAIAQWVSSYDLDLPQGLGTGSLFVENFPAQTRLEGPSMRFNPLAPLIPHPVAQ